jgi:hypothetical protein
MPLSTRPLSARGINPEKVTAIHTAMLVAFAAQANCRGKSVSTCVRIIMATSAPAH